jgi:hypothetical protein
LGGLTETGNDKKAPRTAETWRIRL